MTYNVFTSPKKAFEDSVEEPRISIALIIVILTGIFWSALSLILFNDVISAGMLILVNIMQWLILSVLLFIFEILFSKKNKHKVRADFKVQLSVVGKLWIYTLVTAILFNIFAFNSTNIIGLIAGILIFLIGFIAVYGSFVAVKVVLDASNASSLVAWFFLIVTYFLLLAAASSITTFFLV